MEPYSARYNLGPTWASNPEAIIEKVRARLWNLYKAKNAPYCVSYGSKPVSNGRTETLLDALGQHVVFSDCSWNFQRLSEYVSRCPWYEVFDFIDHYLSLENDATVVQRVDEILRSARTNHCIVNRQVTPLVSPEEAKEVEEAIAGSEDSVRALLAKALKRFSDRDAPDFSETVALSISAVEAKLNRLTPEKKGKITVDTMVACLQTRLQKDSATVLLEAIKKFFGYASQTSRHGKDNPSPVSEAEARLFLIACSAFVNYLNAKFRE